MAMKNPWALGLISRSPKLRTSQNLDCLQITGWWLTYPSEKYKSQLGLIIPNIWNNKTCSKPPTRDCLQINMTNICSPKGDHFMTNSHASQCRGDLVQMRFQHIITLDLQHQVHTRTCCFCLNELRHLRIIKPHGPIYQKSTTYPRFQPRTIFPNI